MPAINLSNFAARFFSAGKQFPWLVVFAICLAVTRPAGAGVTVTNDNLVNTGNAFYPYDPQNFLYGVTTFNMTGANSAPAIPIIADDDPSEGGLGLTAPNQILVGESLAPKRGVAQTFTPTSTFKLGAIAVLAGGTGSVFTDANNVVQTMPLHVHLYQLQNGYISTGPGAGGNPAWPSYTPISAGLGGAPAPDLFGAGAGLTFVAPGQPGSFLELNFSGSDQVTLQAGQHYAVEIAPDFAAASANPNYFPMFFERESGGGFMGGNPYAAGDAYVYTETQDNDIGTTRSNIAGSDRDFFMAIYAVPEPSTIGLLGIGCAGLLLTRFRFRSR